MFKTQLYNHWIIYSTLNKSFLENYEKCRIILKQFNLKQQRKKHDILFENGVWNKLWSQKAGKLKIQLTINLMKLIFRGKQYYNNLKLYYFGCDITVVLIFIVVSWNITFRLLYPRSSSGVPCLSGHRNDPIWEIILKVRLLIKQGVQEKIY